MFMQPEVWHGSCWKVDTDNGIELYPCDYFDSFSVADMTDCDEDDIERVTGFFARLSAPGYLDCTEWSGPFKTEAEARAYLTETYGDDNGEVA